MIPTVTVLVGDALTELGKLPEWSAQTCVTSPPYWGLRDYGTGSWEGGDPACDHEPAKRAIGNAPSVKSTLTTNSGRGPKPGDKFAEGSQSGYFSACPCGASRIDKQVGLEASPDEYAAKLVQVFRAVRRVLKPDGTLWLNLGDSYSMTTRGAGGHSARQDRNAGARQPDRKWQVAAGLKPKDLVGIPWLVAFALRADGWFLRSDIIWAKPNAMPESVTDRPTKAHEYLFLLTKAGRYYYDAEAIQEPCAQPEHLTRSSVTGMGNGQLAKGKRFGTPDPDGRNKRSVWTVPSFAFSEAHFATFPPDLIRPCVLAGSKAGDVVLDPFAGSGTTGQVALEYGRSAVLIELSPDYAELARKRTNVTPGLPLR